ncbi:hypothetical protein GCM10022198_25710 [Klugiella xanthotipulae]|uniref:Uncharacterized protein n=1 Tax=Klugiella xanthotipulae TaxID=244735 RepID=A0A543I5M1_9MICO|nr:hypothetical protein [Klugiella xanthotipulae]TQM65895.1 hypothetical protein FB466_0715 [Klugiella xanthotipulae]
MTVLEFIENAADEAAARARKGAPSPEAGELAANAARFNTTVELERDITFLRMLTTTDTTLRTAKTR